MVSISKTQKIMRNCFLEIFINRFTGKELYILDESEAALSPSRQLALLSRMHELVQEDSL